MQVYSYDKETGEYLGEETAPANPLSGGFIIPAEATELPPPMVGGGRAAVFKNGRWVAENDFRGRAQIEIATMAISEIKTIGDLAAGFYLIDDGQKEQISSGLYNLDVTDGNIVLTDNLAALKDQKVAEIKAERDRREQSGFPYLGKVFDSDPLSVQRISCAAQSAAVAKQAGLPFSIVWTTRDNSVINLNSDQMIGAVPALAMFSGALHQQAAALKAAVNVMTDKEEIAAVIWE